MFKGSPYAHLMIPAQGYYDGSNVKKAPTPIIFPDGPHTSVEWQVAAYSSAAPDFLGAGATVMAPDGKTVLRAGTNGWTCMASTPGYDATKGWESAAAAAPVCLDAAGFPWLQAYMTGATPTIERDAFVWMLNGDLGFDNSNPAVMTEADAAPGQFVKSGPHLMIMPKDPKTLDLFPTDFTKGEPYVMFKGSPYAHLMIPFPGYYEPSNVKPTALTAEAPSEASRVPFLAPVVLVLAVLAYTAMGLRKQSVARTHPMT